MPPGKGCKKRKHTPITTERQKKFFGAEYGRAKKGQPRKTGMSKATLKRHLEEGVKPKRKKK